MNPCEIGGIVNCVLVLLVVALTVPDVIAYLKLENM
jgi:hypothetical protein